MSQPGGMSHPSTRGGMKCTITIGAKRRFTIGGKIQNLCLVVMNHRIGRDIPARINHPLSVADKTINIMVWNAAGPKAARAHPDTVPTVTVEAGAIQVQTILGMEVVAAQIETPDRPLARERGLKTTRARWTFDSRL